MPVAFFAAASLISAGTFAVDAFFGADLLAFFPNDGGAAALVAGDSLTATSAAVTFAVADAVDAFLGAASFACAGAFLGAAFAGTSAFFADTFSGTATFARADAFFGAAFFAGRCTADDFFAGSTTWEPDPSARLRGGRARRTSAATVSSLG